VKVHDKFLKDKMDEFIDTGAKIKNFLVTKMEKNWKRVNEKMHQQKISAEDF
jgi:urate oxidase